MSTLHDRAEQFAVRVKVRAWEHRQRRHAKGTWFRLRLALAHAREVYSVDEGAFAELVAEGFAIEPVGGELEPPKQIAIVPPERAARLGGRPLEVRLSAELLAAPRLVLVPF
jgi:hypothetical protein